MYFSEYVLENYSSDLSKMESMIMNYDMLNITNKMTPIIDQEIKYLNKRMAACKDTDISHILNKHKEGLEKELQSRYYGDKAKCHQCIINICESCNLSKQDRYIFESLDIYPDSVEQDVSRIDRLIESYMKKFSSADMLVASIYPTIISIAKHDDSLLTENMCNLPNYIETKIVNHKDCKFLVEYNTILKESYNDLYFSWDKNKNSNSYKLLKETARICKDLDTVITEALHNPDCNNHESVLHGKIRDCYMNISLPRDIPLSDDVMFEQVIRFGQYLEILEEQIIEEQLKKPEEAGAKSKIFQKNMKIEKKTREFYIKKRQQADADDRNNAPIKRAVDNVQKALLYKLEKIIALDRKSRKERIINGGFRHTIFKVLRRIVMAGLLYVLGGPVFAVIGIIGVVIADEAVDAVTRKKIIHELETELKIINEKISDSKSMGKKREKYQLMRLKAKIEQQIVKSKFGGKYKNAGFRD